MPYYPRIPLPCFVGNYSPSSLLLDWGASGIGGFTDPRSGQYLSDLPGIAISTHFIPQGPDAIPVYEAQPVPTRPEPPRPSLPPRPPSSVPAATLSRPDRPRPANPAATERGNTSTELRSLAANAQALLDAGSLGHAPPPWVGHKLQRATQLIRAVAFAVAYGQVAAGDRSSPTYVVREGLVKIAHNAKYLLEGSTPLTGWWATYVTEASGAVQEVLDYMVVQAEAAEPQTAHLAEAPSAAARPAGLSSPAPTAAGLFCPKGYYFHCKAPFDCSCVKGVRFAAWWAKRPSPLSPQDNPAEAQPAPAPTVRTEVAENPWGLDVSRGVTGPLWAEYERRRRYDTQMTPAAARRVPIRAPQLRNPAHAAGSPNGICPAGTVFAGMSPANNAWSAVCSDPKSGQVASTFGTARTYPYQHLGFYGYHGS